MKAHPLAALLPPLPESELRELADDIRVNGQRQPITVLIEADGSRSILDGLNRLRACKLAGCSPRIVEVTAGEIGDPLAFVVSENLIRRHLAAAQRAMLIAMLYPESQQGAKSGATELRKYLACSRELVRQSRAVLKADPELARAVLEQREPLLRAYAFVTDEQPARQRSRPASSVRHAATNSRRKPPMTSEQRRTAKQVRESHTRTNTSPPSSPRREPAAAKGYDRLRAAWEGASPAARERFAREVLHASD